MECGSIILDKVHRVQDIKLLYTHFLALLNNEPARAVNREIIELSAPVSSGGERIASSCWPIDETNLSVSFRTFGSALVR